MDARMAFTRHGLARNYHDTYRFADRTSSYMIHASLYISEFSSMSYSQMLFMKI